MTAKNESANVAADVEALREDLKRLMADVERLGQSRLADFGDDVRTASGRLVARANDTLDAGRREGERQAEAAVDWIRDHPLAAVAGAMGLGFLLAHLGKRD